MPGEEARYSLAMRLQATLNGPYTKAHHPALPVTLQELAEDARACVRAGAESFHLHPRDSDGRERLDADVVDRVVERVRAACGVPVGVTTGAWIEPDVARRVDLVSAWTAPDFSTVNLCEPGAIDVMQALARAGIGIEAGIWTLDDVELLASSGMVDAVLRICVEPVDLAAGHAVRFVDEIHHALDRHGITAPRLQHGDGEATWILVEDAVRRGIATRIGLEDTTYAPDGSLTTGNPALVRTARTMLETEPTPPRR